MNLKTAVGITMSGAFFGGLFAYIYLPVYLLSDIPFEAWQGMIIASNNDVVTI